MAMNKLPTTSQINLRSINTDFVLTGSPQTITTDLVITYPILFGTPRYMTIKLHCRKLQNTSASPNAFAQGKFKIYNPVQLDWLEIADMSDRYLIAGLGVETYDRELFFDTIPVEFSDYIDPNGGTLLFKLTDVYAYGANLALSYFNLEVQIYIE